MSYRWIAFDAVGTLIYPEPGVAQIYAAIGRQYGSRLSADELGRRFGGVFVKSVAACLPCEDGEILTSEELEVTRWKWIVRQVLDDVADQDGCFKKLYDHFAQPESWRVYDEVATVLEQLRRSGYRLALASNFDARLKGVCCGLAELQPIERIVVSTEVGACKPSPRFYQSLLKICGCRPDELLMVGDDFDHDVAGPQRLGISARLVDREGTSADAGHSLAAIFADGFADSPHP